MLKCKCGCTEFSAAEEQIRTVTVQFDESHNIANDFDTDDMDVIRGPYGPFVCVNCGAHYDTEEDIPDDCGED